MAFFVSVACSSCADRPETVRRQVESCPAFSREGLTRAEEELEGWRWGSLVDGGFYVVEGKNNLFTLWYKPHDGKWDRVKSEILIEKLEGGSVATLPLRYAGKGKFLIAETVKGKGVDGRHLCRTLLLDGTQVVANTQNHKYDAVPVIDIPDSWFKLHQIVLSDSDPLDKPEWHKKL
jgi:hypothetical protein